MNYKSLIILEVIIQAVVYSVDAFPHQRSSDYDATSLPGSNSKELLSGSRKLVKPVTHVSKIIHRYLLDRRVTNGINSITLIAIEQRVVYWLGH